MSSFTRYNLRQNNYKETLKIKLVNEISKYATKIETTSDIAKNITNCHRIYKLLNDNNDIFYTCNRVIDNAYNRINILTDEIRDYMAKNPTKSLKSCHNTLLQFAKFKHYYEHFWISIIITLNIKTCPDMSKEIMQYIH